MFPFLFGSLGQQQVRLLGVHLCPWPSRSAGKSRGVLSQVDGRFGESLWTTLPSASACLGM